MKQFFMIVMLVFFITSKSAHAGFLSSFASSVAANVVTSSGSSSRVYSSSEMKYINKVLWDHIVKKKEDDSIKLDGYEFYAEALANSSSFGYIDTAAQAYYLYGDKEKAINLYEYNIVPILRGYPNKNYAKTYMMMKGYKSKDEIKYSELYEKINREKESKSSPNMPFSIILMFLTISILLLLNIAVLIFGLSNEKKNQIILFFKSIKLKTKKNKTN